MEILTSSLQEFWSTFSLSKLIMLLMVIFMIVGGIDKSAATSTDTENGLTADFKRSVTWRPR